MTTLYERYQQVITNNLCLEPNDWFFKNQTDYVEILEHVSYSYGNEYLALLSEKFADIYTTNKDYIINVCILNDTYGKTKKYKYDNFCECSPTNLRYIFHACLILQHMKKNNMIVADVIEIGGGYGGLCLFVHKLSPLFNIKICSYTIFDLPEPMMLQKRYLELHEIYINTFNVNDNFTLNDNCFLISNYAFSEIRMDLQKLYTERVINPYTTHGFLTWNAIDVYDFAKNKIIQKEKEYPLTHQLNYYVYY